MISLRFLRLYGAYTKSGDEFFNLNLVNMTLFEIGGALLIAGIFNILYVGLAPRFKDKDKNGRIGVMFFCFLIALVGGILMLVG